AYRTVPDQDILTNAGRIMGFKANTIVVGINVRIGDSYTIAIHYINAVVVPECAAVNRNTVYRKVFALVIRLYPCSPVSDGYSFYQDILAGAEIEYHLPYFHFGTIVTKRIFDQSFVNNIRHIPGYLSSLSFNYTFARYPGIFLIMTKY